MAIDPITGAEELATAFVNKFFPDKAQEEKDAITIELQGILAQTNIDNSEAQSTDPLQHWRGGLGWVCTLSYAWNFVGKPLADYLIAVFHIQMVSPPPIDGNNLFALTAGMLGLGGMHVYQTIKGK